MPKVEQPEPLKYEPVRKSPAELKAEAAAELERQLEYYDCDCVKDWKEKFPEKWKADVKRLEEALGKLKGGRKKKKKEEED